MKTRKQMEHYELVGPQARLEAYIILPGSKQGTVTHE